MILKYIIEIELVELQFIKQILFLHKIDYLFIMLLFNMPLIMICSDFVRRNKNTTMC
jgi:hypothetical protein